MRAMTEIPAKTPRPMGSTDNFFPGNAKLDEVGDSTACAVPEAAPAVAVVDVVADVEVLVVDAVEDEEAVVAGPDTVDTPTTTIGGDPPEPAVVVVAAEDEVVDLEACDEVVVDTGTDVTPMTTTAPDPDAVAEDVDEVDVTVPEVVEEVDVAVPEVVEEVVEAVVDDVDVEAVEDEAAVVDVEDCDVVEDDDPLGGFDGG